MFRLLFFLFNYDSFNHNSFSQILLAFVVGLRFDVSAVIYINSLFILLHLVPFNFRYLKGYQVSIKWIFFLTNFAALFFALIDLRWFSFVEKRSSFDIFGTTGDMMNQLPSYLKDYWYLLIVYGFIIFITLWFYNRIKLTKTEYKFPPKSFFIFQIAILFLICCLSILGARGGWQRRPIIPISAASYVSSSLVPLTTNTPFNIIITSQGPSLKPVKYFNELKLKKLFSIQRINNVSMDSMRRDNVVIIIWESLSRYYMGNLNENEGYTPFLDSLAKGGLVCTNASANAHRSIEGLPSITASIPTMMDEAFTFSKYQQDKIEGLPSILKKFGYSSAFFHGGINGSMAFDFFAAAAGYESYFGMNEFNNVKEFDGTWGIWDESFFQYVNQQLISMQEPFFATLFTLTSHPPFMIPKRYEQDFQKQKNQYAQVIRYTDYSLKKFFETASKQPWFNRTLFVIVADHGAHFDSPLYHTPRGGVSIPIVFYSPNKSLKGVYNQPVQQIDILPSVIDFLQVPCKYVSFGESIFKKDSVRYVYNFLNGIYHIEDEQYHLEFDGTKTVALFDYTSDPLFLKNILGTLPGVKMRLEEKLKAVIQTFNDALINNKLLPE